jgi:deoxyribonucleoside regulator
MKEERFIIKVLEMHYKQGMSQLEIGKKLNVSR